jgi:AcrR family transcriptional regulator
MTDMSNAQPPDAGPRPVGRPRRSQQDLLAAAAAVFVESGVDAPVREIATRAGVGMGTIYRHFPTRPALVVAVYRHQVEACAEAGPRLLTESPTAEAALRAWVALLAWAAWEAWVALRAWVAWEAWVVGPNGSVRTIGNRDERGRLVSGIRCVRAC